MSGPVLVTGGAGFIGSNFVRFLLRERPEVEVINLDALTYAGRIENLAGLEEEKRHRFVRGDICDAALVEKLMEECGAVVHLAAESHVDRSIMDSGPFVRTNIEGTRTLLDAARRAGGRRFVQASTDEVYGSLPLEDPTLKFAEDSPLRPNNPYAASKAAADLLVRSYGRTFKLETIIARSTNNFGPYQLPEKVIPLFVTNLFEGRKVPLYGDGRNVRDWLHVADHCEALLAVLERGRPGEIYNIGADNGHSNLELTGALLELTGHGEEMIERVADRPGHDLRYALDVSKIERELGWRATRSAWPMALTETVRWYRENPGWWKPAKDGDRITGSTPGGCASGAPSDEGTGSCAE